MNRSRGRDYPNQRQMLLLLGSNSRSTTIIINGGPGGDFPDYSNPNPFDPPPDPFPEDPGDPPDQGGGDGGGAGLEPPVPPPSDCIPPLPLALRVNLAVIREHEGVERRSYVLPIPKFSQSGVTIGMGVDLAYHPPSSLSAWGVPQSVISALSPFLARGPGVFGPRGAAAHAALANFGPVTLSSANEQLISMGGFNLTKATLEANFNRDQRIGVNFSELPMEAQTVMMDVAYPYGPNFYRPEKAPRFWGHLVNGRFRDAANELRNWSGPGNAKPRELRLAALLEAGIMAGALPNDAVAGRCT